MKKSKLKTRKSNPAFAGQEFGFSLKATILLLNTEYRKLNTLLIFALCLCASVAKSDVHYVSKKGTRIVGRKGVGKHNIRCVYLGTNVFITGFKITGGGTIFVDDIDYENIDGAGIYSKNGAIISNCYIYNNVTFINWGGNGGGIHANNSLITDCS